MHPKIKVKVENSGVVDAVFCFSRPFQIGRAAGCDIEIQEDVTSRVHAKVIFRDANWWIFDLQSSNGLWIDDVRIDHAPLENNTKVELRPGGPALIFTIGEKKPSKKKKIKQLKKNQDDALAVKRYESYYFGDSQADDIGQHTMMLRLAYERVKNKQKRMYLGIISIVVCLLLLAGIYVVLKHLEIQKQKKTAQEIFYSMKSLELELSNVLDVARMSRDVRLKKNAEIYRVKIKEMGEQYDRLIRAHNVYDDRVDEKSRLIVKMVELFHLGTNQNTEANEKNRLILKMVRTFGECEVNIPEDFIKEVLNFINKWKSTKRLEKSLKRAKDNGYIYQTMEAMKDNGLPLQLLYLGLQESDFNVNACGPETRFGIAKGAWQFIPSTAREYGLRIGPLENERIIDVQDERHDFGKSTKAAAMYLRHIYDDKAQGSWLLAVASYNWGQERVSNLIQKMPKNPRERNFWRIISENRDQIPKETYDYIFYIFSAAVIGENPHLFGFNFDNPLILAGNESDAKE